MRALVARTTRASRSCNAMVLQPLPALPGRGSIPPAVKLAGIESRWQEMARSEAVIPPSGRGGARISPLRAEPADPLANEGMLVDDDDADHRADDKPRRARVNSRVVKRRKDSIPCCAFTHTSAQTLPDRPLVARAPAGRVGCPRSAREGLA